MRLAGVAGDERVFTPAPESLRKRLPWLGVNLATAFLAAAVVGLFQGNHRPDHGAGGLHADRRGDGRQRRYADAHRHRSRHRARRADLGEFPQGAAQGRPGGAWQRRDARPGRGAGRLFTKGDAVLGLLLCAAMIINMFVAATAGTLVPLGLRAMNVTRRWRRPCSSRP